MIDYLRLPGGNWYGWRGIVLRGAGFPLHQVEQLGDESLAQVADQILGASPSSGRLRLPPNDVLSFEAEFDRAVARVESATESVAQDHRFREAITWQNPQFVQTCLDRLPDRRNNRSRKREMAIASYIQRYTTKNESIGFFGPVGWASWEPEQDESSITPGARLLSDRTVYFESWALDAVATSFADRPELRHEVPPRLLPANLLCEGHVVRPVGASVPLTPEDSAILRLCDGVRTVREIASLLNCAKEGLLERLRALSALDVVRLDFGGPIETYPEHRLRDRLLRVEDADARRCALDDLDRLVGAKDRVAETAGDPVRLAGAIAELGAEFERIAGRSAVRMHGQTYAGRTIAYEDTVRDVEVRLGANVWHALGEPLSLVLHSGRWLVAHIGQDYLSRFSEYHERKQRRTGQDWVPLAGLLALATRDFYTGSGMPALAHGAIAELQRRWAAILNIPEGVRRHTVKPDEIADLVRAEFASNSPDWAGGLHHSPDVMIAAKSVAAMNQGDFQLILGELHLAFNTIESRALVEQSPDQERLMSMAEAAVGSRRIMPVAPREWGVTTARTSPPSALLSPKYLYWAMGTDDVSNLSAEVLPVSALEVGHDGEELVVRCRLDGRTFPLAQVIGEYISQVALNAFRLLPHTRHTPRITIGNLVVAREKWRLPPRKCDWVHQLDERKRYLQMREWVARLGLPRHAFYAVSIETKPVYVDFTSIPLTNNFASVVRRMAGDGSDGDIAVSEMLPGPDSLWLTDHDGQAYTSELRMVVAEHVE